MEMLFFGGRRLIEAVKRGDTQEVRRLLVKGANPNARDGIGTTPLMYAILLRQPAIVKMLLANGADPNAKTNPGHWAHEQHGLKVQVKGKVAVLDIARARNELDMSTGILANVLAKAEKIDSPEPRQKHRSKEIEMRLIFELLEKAGAENLSGLSPEKIMLYVMMHYKDHIKKLNPASTSPGGFRRWTFRILKVVIVVIGTPLVWVAEIVGGIVVLFLLSLLIAKIRSCF